MFAQRDARQAGRRHRAASHLPELLSRNGLLADSSRKNPLAPKAAACSAAKAKAVISIFCYGGVSQVDTFDPEARAPEAAGRDDDRAWAMWSHRMGNPAA